MQRQDEAVKFGPEVLVGKLVVVAAQRRLAFSKVTTELASLFPTAFANAHVLTLGAAEREPDAASGTRFRVNRLNEIREADLADLGRNRARRLAAFKRLER